MDHHNDSTATDLYLVRIWRGRRSVGLQGLHGKVQHIVSGASCQFNGLADLPGVLAMMMEQGTNTDTPTIESASYDALSEEDGIEAR